MTVQQPVGYFMLIFLSFVIVFVYFNSVLNPARHYVIQLISFFLMN